MQHSGILSISTGQLKSRAPELKSKHLKCAMEVIRASPGRTCSPSLSRVALRSSRACITADIGNTSCVSSYSINLRRNSANIGPFCTKSGLSIRNGGGSTGGEKHSVGDNDGVIIVDHGSRRRESNLMLNEFVAMFRVKTGYAIVEPAHMELAVPSIKDAFTACVQQGANRVIVSPFFLFPGRHWHQDIPSLTAEAAREHPGVLYIVTAPLGLHELLVDVVNDRIKYCLSHVAGDAGECNACTGTSACHLRSM